MKLYRPRPLIFWIAFILGALGFVGRFVSIPYASAYSYWFVFAGFVLLVLGVLYRNL